MLTAILLAGSRFWHRINDKNVQSYEGSVSGNNIDYTGHVLQSSLLRINSFQISGKPTAAITSHHLPTAENFIHSIYAGLKSQNPDIETFIIVGPDHFEQCGSLITMTKKNFLTPSDPVLTCVLSCAFIWPLIPRSITL